MLIVWKGSFQYHYATGLQNYGVDEKPIQEDAVLMLASCTKLLTSIAALQAVEQGIIGLDDDVRKHIPELGSHGILEGFDEDDKPKIKEVKNTITLRQLLTHSSGATYSMIPDMIKMEKQRGRWGKHIDNAGTILERYDLPLIAQPGESWMYSPGLDWTGLLLKRLTGNDLDALIKKNILTPLNITGITFWPSEDPALKDKIPQLTVRTPEGKLAPMTDATLNTGSTDCFGGHGGYAQMGSYLKVLQSLLANDGKLLKPSTVDMMFTPQLGEGSKTAMNIFKDMFGHMLIGEIEKGIPMDHGLGGALFMEGDVGRRRKGTMQWGGLVNPFWLIDREAGIAMVFGTQVLPPGDPGEFSFLFFFWGVAF